MSRVRARIEIDAPIDAVWSTLEPIGSHAQWMADCESIEFLSPSHSGLGTRFIAYTKVGPIKLADQMEITVWDPPRAMGVHHAGLVTGTGEFTLTSIDQGRRTRFEWDEDLTFPWWLGGPIGGYFGGTLLLGRIWRGNLKRFRSLVEAPT